MDKSLTRYRLGYTSDNSGDGTLSAEGGEHVKLEQDSVIFLVIPDDCIANSCIGLDPEPIFN